MNPDDAPITTDYAGCEFVDNDFTNARFRNVDLTAAKIRGASMNGVDIDGIITGLVVNGIEVEPLIRAEKLRRQPELATLTFLDAAGACRAWALTETTWAATMTRALALPPDALHARVDGEWSFLQTLRHLVFATDAWVGRTALGRHCSDNDSPGYPADPAGYTVEACLRTVIHEEWEHHEFAVRDLALLS